MFPQIDMNEITKSTMVHVDKFLKKPLPINQTRNDKEKWHPDY